MSKSFFFFLHTVILLTSDSVTFLLSSLSHWKETKTLRISVEQCCMMKRHRMIDLTSHSVSFHSGWKWSPMSWILCKTVLLVDPTSRNEWVSIVTFGCTLQHCQVNFLFRWTLQWKSDFLILIRSSRTLSISTVILHSNIALVDESNCAPNGKTSDWLFFSHNCLDGLMQKYSTTKDFL